MTGRRVGNGRRNRGSVLTEFSLDAFQLFLLIFAAIEFCRMILVYTTIADSARVAARYATVHGSDSTTSATVSGVCGVVTNYATFLNTAALTCGGASGSRIAVSWPDGATTPGSRVQVTVVYTYDPFFSALPLGVDLGSTAEEYIMY